MKTIVTHLSPDLDSITSTWLIKRFLPGWQEAKIEFVPAGSTLNNEPPDINSNIIHVDTGLGKLDHHQTQAYTSASKLVYQYLLEQNCLKERLVKPLERMTNFVTDIDHFGEAFFPEATADRYDFNLYQIVEGLKPVINDQHKLMETVFPMLDAVLQVMRNKIAAEEDLKNGFVFRSKFGKSVAMETKNEEASKLALKSGFSLVVRKDPEKGHVRIKSLPKKELDLTPVYQKLHQIDKKATWFLHVSKNMLLNSSSKNPNFIPSTLPLNRLIKIIKEV